MRGQTTIILVRTVVIRNWQYCPRNIRTPERKGKDRNVFQIKKATRVQSQLPTGLNRTGPSLQFQSLSLSLLWDFNSRSENASNLIIIVLEFVSSSIPSLIAFSISAGLRPLEYLFWCLFEQFCKISFLLKRIGISRKNCGGFCYNFTLLDDIWGREVFLLVAEKLWCNLKVVGILISSGVLEIGSRRS